jgi:peptidoglycan/xylan/chitin deacetylase (PgdA/CDA1 family)
MRSKAAEAPRPRARAWRTAVTLASGGSPPFVFGFGVGAILPVFRFGSVTVDQLDPALHYLAENRYHAVTADTMAAVIAGDKPAPERAVALLFDGALASLWTVAFPLLKRYGLRAIAYAVPGRVAEADTPRPTLDDGPINPDQDDAGDCPLSTWPELTEMSASGWVDVQSNSWSHSMIFAGARPTGVLRPLEAPDALFLRPRLNADDPPQFLAADRFGHPLFRLRPRLSDARRFVPNPDDIDAVESFVEARGRATFFARAGWRRELAPLLRRVRGAFESAADQQAAITHELITARDTIEARLGIPARHLNLPWGIAGRFARKEISRLGFATVIAPSWNGPLYASRGGDPLRLGGLDSRYIYSLPGKGRRILRKRTGS